MTPFCDWNFSHRISLQSVFNYHSRQTHGESCNAWRGETTSDTPSREALEPRLFPGLSPLRPCRWKHPRIVRGCSLQLGVHGEAGIEP